MGKLASVTGTHPNEDLDQEDALGGNVDEDEYELFGEDP